MELGSFVTLFGDESVMTMHLGLLFSFHLSSPYCTTDPPFPLLLVIALSWTYLLTPRLGQDALRTVRSSPYLLHALPSLLLYYLCVHQCLLMCTFRAPPMPASPHCCLMYHCTICAHYRTVTRRLACGPSYLPSDNS